MLARHNVVSGTDWHSACPIDRPGGVCYTPDASPQRGECNPLSAIGLVFQIAYRLRRHLWLGWPLSRWLGTLLIMSILWQLIRWRSLSWQVIVLAALFLIYILVLVWAGRQGYVRFADLSSTEEDNLLGNAPRPPPLGIQEMVSTQASGWFAVEGEDRYYLDIEADYQTVSTREHMVLGRVHPSSFILFGKWPQGEFGWWYIFFEPRIIRDVCLGYLHFGLRPQLALRVIYAPDAETQQAVYLTFEDTTALRQVRDDLLLDVPQDVGR